MVPENSLPSVGSQLLALSKINDETSSRRLAELHGRPLEEQHRVLAEIFDRVRELLSVNEIGSQLYKPFEAPLTADEYVLPSELEQIHSTLVAHLTSSAGNETLPYAGLALHGIPGTGKTQYVRYLHGCLPNVTCVAANNNVIRDSASPGQSLSTLYSTLEDVAQKSGRYVVLLIDEFDKLINKHAHVQRTVESTTTSSHSEKRSNSQTHQRTDDAFTMDDTGEALLSTLKTVLSGTGRLSRVYTICTTNQTNIPAELTRSDRLQAVRLWPFGMQTRRESQANYANVPIYHDYHTIVPRMLRIFDSAHFRLQKEHHPVLKEMESAVAAFFSEKKSYEDYKNTWENTSEGGVRSSRSTFLDHNFALLKEFLDFLECHPDILSPHSSLLREFGGAMDGKRYRSWGSHDTVFPEVAAMQGEYATPAYLSGVYKDNPRLFDSMSSVKQTLAQLLFPQLRPRKDNEL